MLCEAQRVFVQLQDGPHMLYKLCTRPWLWSNWKHPLRHLQKRETLFSNVNLTAAPETVLRWYPRINLCAAGTESHAM